MNYFKRPYDAKLLLRKKRKIRDDLLASRSDWLTKRIAVLGGSTTNEFVEQLEIFLLNQGIKANFYQSDFGKYWEDAMYGNETFDNFNPDIIYIHTNWRNIINFPDILDSENEIEIKINNEYQRFFNMWNHLKEKFGCPIIQNNFDRPDYRLLGNMDIWDKRGRSNYVTRLNQMIYEYAQNNNEFYINDIDYIASYVGYEKWNKTSYWYLYKYFCNVNVIPYVSDNIANIIKSIYGKNKKVLVLDLDNTLWGGIVGDDGADNIQIGNDTPKGEAFLCFQEYCKQLQKIGVLLAINSKNDERNAFAGLHNKENILHEEDFVSIKANWNRKDSNILEISNDLSLGTDSFVCVDDNPVERDIVKTTYPHVTVLDINDVEDFIDGIDNGGYFEKISFSDEDLKKTAQYIERKKVYEQSKTFENYEDFLASLNMEVVISDFKSDYISRISQLTNKSNQFNLTTLRCTEKDILAMQEDPKYVCLCGRLKDKYGDNGLVTVVAGEIKDCELHIRLWLMSCRVLKRELEYEMMNNLMKIAREKGLKKVIGYYYPTEKNEIVNDFYKKVGFSLLKSDESESLWTVDAADYKTINTQIQYVRLLD